MINGGMGFDASALRTLRSTAERDPKAAIQSTAKQFESIFMQELMKSMRQATMASGMLDNGGTKLGTELLDGQLSQKLTGLPGGLSAMIARQLERQMGTTVSGADAAAAAKAMSFSMPARGAATVASPSVSTAGTWDRLPGLTKAEDFVAKHTSTARAVEAETGIPSAFILGQAAHESGWGKREIKTADGGNSFNVFGIKAGANWKGPTADVTTTEYVNGVPRKMVQTFRAYSSYEEGFRDYAQLIKNSPRYAKVVEQGGTAQGFAVNLQRAGYATDPAYADKLGRVINTTLRLQRTLQV